MLLGKSFCFSQSLTQNLLSAAGGSSVYAGNSFDWTLGEIAVETLSTTEISYKEGFLQPFAVNIEKETANNPSFQLSFMPNPVHDELRITMPFDHLSKTDISLIDASGRIVLAVQKNPDKGFITLNIASLVPGIYFMQINNIDFPSKVLKVIKF